MSYLGNLFWHGPRGDGGSQDWSTTVRGYVAQLQQRMKVTGQKYGSGMFSLPNGQRVSVTIPLGGAPVVAVSPGIQKERRTIRDWWGLIAPSWEIVGYDVQHRVGACTRYWAGILGWGSMRHGRATTGTVSEDGLLTYGLGEESSAKFPVFLPFDAGAMTYLVTDCTEPYEMVRLPTHDIPYPPDDVMPPWSPDSLVVLTLSTGDVPDTQLEAVYTMTVLGSGSTQLLFTKQSYLRSAIIPGIEYVVGLYVRVANPEFCWHNRYEYQQVDSEEEVLTDDRFLWINIQDQYYGKLYLCNPTYTYPTTGVDLTYKIPFVQQVTIPLSRVFLYNTISTAEEGWADLTHPQFSRVQCAIGVTVGEEIIVLAFDLVHVYPEGEETEILESTVTIVPVSGSAPGEISRLFNNGKNKLYLDGFVVPGTKHQPLPSTFTATPSTSWLITSTVIPAYDSNETFIVGHIQ